MGSKDHVFFGLQMMGLLHQIFVEGDQLGMQLSYSEGVVD